MAEQPDRIDSGSPEAVAFKLWHVLYEPSSSVEEKLELYAKCRRATKGIGEYKLQGPMVR